MADELGMEYFTEASAKTGENVEEVFLTTIALCKRKLSSTEEQNANQSVAKSKNTCTVS